MITTINTLEYTFRDGTYNHNYYVSKNGKVILEECDDDNGFYYWWVDPNTNKKTEYIGLVISTFGIFDSNYDGFPSKDNKDIINIDSNFC